jgi:hypothetical protein
MQITKLDNMVSYGKCTTQTTDGDPSETTPASEGVESDGHMDDSNKKMKRTSVMFVPRSADQAGAVEQPRQTQ